MSASLGGLTSRRRVLALASAASLALILAACTGDVQPSASDSSSLSPSSESPRATPVEVPAPARLPGIISNVDLELANDSLERWDAETQAEVVQVPSSVDGAAQNVLWTTPAEADAPLVVHLHSWGAGFDQQVGIPVALWAESVGWGFLQPDFRGPNNNPSATGSTLSTQDVLDAVDYAVDQGVDADRVYVTGFSGGGMMSLLLAGRHPDRFAGAASWVPVYDLVSWFAYNRDAQTDTDYAAEIVASCSGDPTAVVAARDDCLSRSPVSVMDAIREAEMPVYIGGGVADSVVPAVDVLRAFNAIADEPDRIPDELLGAVSIGGLPDGILGDVTGDARFTPKDPGVLFSRQSGAATAVIFDGEHEFVFYPGLDWLARLDASLQAAG